MSRVALRARLAITNQASSLFLMVAFAVASARWLGPSGKGELVMVTTAGVVVGSIIALGIPQALTAWVARDRMSVRTSILVGSAWSVVLAGVLLVGATVSHVDSLAISLLWLSAGVTIFEQVMTGVSAGAGDLVPPLVSRWIGGGSQVALMAGALALGLEPNIPTVTVWYYVVALAGVAVAIAALLARSGGIGTPAPAGVRDFRHEAADISRFGLKAVPGQILSMTNFKLDVLLLGWVSTAAAVGVYSLAVSATLLVGVIPAALGQALTRSFGEDLDPTVRLRRGFQLALFAGLGTAAAIIVVSPFLVPLVFGSGFSGATALIAVMVPFTAIFATVQVSFPYFYNRLHRPLVQSMVIGVTAAVDVVLVLILAPRFGAMGAACASAAAYAVGAAVNIAVTARGASLSVRELVVPGGDDVAWAVSQARRAIGPRRRV